MRSSLFVLLVLATVGLAQDKVRIEVTLPPPKVKTIVREAPPVIIRETVVREAAPPVIIREAPPILVGYVQMPKYRLVRDDEPDYWFPGKVILRPWRK